MTALVRHTLRALTLNDMAPETALHQLNRALREGTDDDRLCTVLLGLMRVEPEGAVLEVFSAGHPGPLVARAAGGIEELELAGTLLGVFSDAHVDGGVLTLSPGDEILLYTAGSRTRAGRASSGSRASWRPWSTRGAGG